MLIVLIKINASFINSENSRNSDPHKLVSDIAEKLYLERSDKYVTFLNLSFYNP